VGDAYELLQRSKDFAATCAHEEACIARHKVCMITCLDPRTDPSAFLELDLGDTMVVRNTAGRFWAEVLKDLVYTGHLASALVPGRPRFKVAVVHHTHCGTRFLADDKLHRGFADLIGGSDATLVQEAVTDLEQAIRFHVELGYARSIGISNFGAAELESVAAAVMLAQPGELQSLRVPPRFAGCLPLARRSP
jgi:carbonic anhydrase